MPLRQIKHFDNTTGECLQYFILNGNEIVERHIAPGSTITNGLSKHKWRYFKNPSNVEFLIHDAWTDAEEWYEIENNTLGRSHTSYHQKDWRVVYTANVRFRENKDGIDRIVEEVWPVTYTFPSFTSYENFLSIPDAISKHLDNEWSGLKKLDIVELKFERLIDPK